MRALAKLEQVLPARLRPRVGAVAAATVSLPGAGPTVDASVLTAIAAACRDHERLRFGYGDRSGAETERSVEPLRLVCTGRRWYLVAYDLDRAGWRTFRVDRITGVPAASFRFTPREPPADDLAAYVSRQISSAPYVHQLVLRVAAPAEEVARRVPPTTGAVEAIDEHCCRVRTGANTLDTVPYYLAQWGFDFVVEEAPPGLVERLREVAERFARAVG
ncbi:WYL domain-containing protein [Amycolatopsis eburnea]|uniref:WYL domain-containing protein n=1 Tax=Amycolatopsis eburnea TaxID=2267691 RepID=A0A3R9FMD2_9PSEU|nr:WYL domain-containing protein [Amycolatopsis eburnea]